MQKTKKRVLLWLLCLIALFGTAGMAGAATEELMNVITSSTATPLPIGYNGDSFDVLKPGTVTLKPDITEENGYTYTYVWKADGIEITGILTPTQYGLPGTLTGNRVYTCTVTRRSPTAEDTAWGEHVARVTIDVVAPKISGPTFLMPGGAEGTYKPGFSGTPAGAYNNYTYAWTVEATAGAELAYEASAAESPEFTLAVKEHDNAWLLFGGELKCKISVNGQTKTFSFPDKDGLQVGITVHPASGEPELSIPADEKGVDGRAIAKLELDAVYGGNAKSTDLTYKWEKKDVNTGGAWTPTAVPGSKGTFNVNLDSGTWSGETRYRCVVGLQVPPLAGPSMAAADEKIATTSAVFRVFRAAHPLQVKMSWYFPFWPLVTDGGPADEVKVKGVILLPANKNGEEAPDTTYLAKIQEYVDGAWLDIPGSESSDKREMEPGDKIGTEFTPGMGIHKYRLYVSSDAGEDSFAFGKPFQFTVANRNIDVTSWTSPKQDAEGRLVVRPGQAITYGVEATGGSGKWIYVWKDSVSGIIIPTDSLDLDKLIEQLRGHGIFDWVSWLACMVQRSAQRGENPSFIHNLPIQGMAVALTVYAVDHNGAPIRTKGCGKVHHEGDSCGECDGFEIKNLWDKWETLPCLKKDVTDFGMPWVKLEWATLPGDTAVPFQLLADGKEQTIGWLRAKGGTSGLFCSYWYSIDGGKWTQIRYVLPLSLLDGSGTGPAMAARKPESNLPDVSTSLAPLGVYFRLSSEMLGHDFGDGRSGRFSVRFKAEDMGGQNVISDPVTLTVLQDATLLIDGAQWNGEAYVAEFREGNPPTLKAELLGTESAASFKWTLSGFEPVQGATWTPSALQASDEPYGVTVDALDGEGTVLDSVTLRLTVLPATDLKATAAFEHSTVSADTMAVLTMQASAGSGNYRFEAGAREDDLKEIQANADGSSAAWSFRAPKVDGIYTYWWKVTDTDTGDTRSGSLPLTVTGGRPGDEVQFTIRAPYGAALKKGTSFEMMVENSGTRYVTATDLTWDTGNNTIATVNDRGVVDIVGTGEVTIGATVTGSDPANRETFTFTAMDASYRVIIPEVKYKSGDSVDVTMTTEPAGGKFSYTGKLPGDLELSENGRLTGTAPAAGTYYIDSVTVTWSDGHVETRENVPIKVTGGGGGGGGGCNGGFGLLALALGGFLALKRKA